MYVRWQHRTPRRAGQPPARRTDVLPTAGDLALEATAIAVSRPVRSRRPKQAALVAVLVESHRIDGQPRQRLVKYLGAIRRDDVHRVNGRHEFWARVDGRLAGFAPEARARFVAAIEVVVSRPTADEVVALLKPASEEMARRAAAIKTARARMAAFRIDRAAQGRVEPPTTPRRKSA